MVRFKNLNHKAIISIFPIKPFAFDYTFFKPDHFSTKDMHWESGKRWQTMLFEKKLLGLIFKDKSSKSTPKIAVEVYSEKGLNRSFLNRLKSEIVWRYNLDLELAKFYRSVKNDSIIKPVVHRFYGLRPINHGSLYEYLIIGITLQNCTVKRSVYMMQTLFEKYGSLLKFCSKKLWCFWEPKKLAEVDERELRMLKMGYRAKSLIRISQEFAAKKVDECELRSKSEEEQKKALLSLYGVGPATVGYIMFDVFHRFGFLDHISPWEQKIYTRLFFGKNYEEEIIPVDKMVRFFKNRWGKWTSLAVHYVWEDLWWRHKQKPISWLRKLITV